MLAKTNPSISLRYDPENKALVILEPFSKRQYLNRPELIFGVLEHCLQPKTADDVLSFLTNEKNKVDIKEAHAFMRDLINLQLLVEDNEEISAIERIKNKWFDHGWVETWYFHTALYDYPFADYKPSDSWIRDEALMEEYAEQESPPPIYKAYESSELTLLPAPSEELMKGMKFGGPDKEYKLTPELFSAIAYLCFGETGEINLPVLGKSLLKTSPSGGARHPAEAYVYLLDDNAAEKGIYHYSVKEHGLVKINTLEGSRPLGATFHYLTHKPGFRPEFIFVITDIYRRSMWRYREPRSMRAVVLDLGHLVTTLKYVAKSLGYEVVDSHGFDEKQIFTDLKLDDPTEKPMYFLAFGKYAG